MAEKEVFTGDTQWTKVPSREILVVFLQQHGVILHQGDPKAIACFASVANQIANTQKSLRSLLRDRKKREGGNTCLTPQDVLDAARMHGL